jgi:hypothetical protein
MMWSDIAYRALVWVHLLLFVLWLGADVGVFTAGRHFRMRAAYSLDQRLAILKLLVAVDMVPRTAFALMVPLSLSVARMGGWWEAPVVLIAGAWAFSGLWLWLVWDAHHHDQTPRAARNRRIEGWMRHAAGLGYLGLGLSSVLTRWPIEPAWLAWKALLFGAIFVAAFFIDFLFKPVGPLLMRVVNEGSSDVTELPLRAAMDRARVWVRVTYALLLAISFLGVAKPVW